MRAPPTVVISLDFELAWGAFDVLEPNQHLAAARWTNEVGAPLLLDMLEARQIPATWATVGALMHDGLDDRADGLEEVDTPWFPWPWMSMVPKGRGAADAPEWFAPRFIERLQASSHQEVGFHGWTHAVFGDPGTTRERIRQELSLCRQTSDELGLNATSFVFPRNAIAGVDLLREHGFACYRGRDPVPLELPGRGRALSLGAADALGLTPPLVEARMVEGIVEIPGSLMVRSAEDWRGMIPDATRGRRLRLGLEGAAREGGLFHLWLHPINLYARHPRLSNVLSSFFGELAVERDKGNVAVVSMGAFARDAAKRLGKAEEDG